MRRLKQKVPSATFKKPSKSLLKFFNILNAITIERIKIFQRSFFEIELPASTLMLSHCHEQKRWQFKKKNHKRNIRPTAPSCSRRHI